MLLCILMLSQPASANTIVSMSPPDPDSPFVPESLSDSESPPHAASTIKAAAENKNNSFFIILLLFQKFFNIVLPTVLNTIHYFLNENIIGVDAKVRSGRGIRRCNSFVTN